MGDERLEGDLTSHDHSAGSPPLTALSVFRPPSRNTKPTNQWHHQVATCISESPDGPPLADDYTTWDGVAKAADEFALLCEFDMKLDGKKWIIRKPPLEWFAERPDLPYYCLHGATEHYVGAKMHI